MPTGQELHDDQQLLTVAPLGEGRFKYWGLGTFTTPDVKCWGYVGDCCTHHPPAFFDLQEGSSASNTLGGGNSCWSMDWQIDPTTDSIAGSCYEFEYSYNSLLIEWSLHRVGPPPPGG